MKKSNVVAMLHDLLKPLGFKKKNATWNRSGKVVEVINVQTSEAGDSVTVNAGILDREIYPLLWQKRPPDPVDAAFCTVRVRIGQLIDDLDHWWSLENPATGAEVTKAVADYVLPFLQRTQSHEEMEDWLIRTNVVRKGFPLDVMTLAVIKGRLGKKEEALALLLGLQKRATGAWTLRIVDVEKYLGTL